ncbi:dehydrogenase [Paenibacillus abyssi]|uniref:Dehydrogenase n=2 Tax=Paenibacillus abyssi TaxID=1340531 RepID=A0A917FWG6_9BACL|nr:dehydrogenase [Paenibacillus abyssi]
MNHQPVNQETNTNPPVNVEDEASELSSAYEVAAAHLQAPWSIDFDDDTIFISERDGAIVKVEDGEISREAVQLSIPVHQQGEGGFMGFVLDPDFAVTRQAYAYYTYMDNGTILNRIVALQYSGSEWNEVNPLLEQIPGSSVHNGGRLAIGPDGLLYATTGDARIEALSQDQASLAGKILRLNLDGSIPEENPFDDSYIYSWGHRNPQGLAWDSDRRLFSSEHGPSGNPGGHDEINLIEPGLNYGWPAIIGDDTKQGMVAPLYHTGSDTLAPSGMALTADNELLVAGLRGQKLVRFHSDMNGYEVLLENEGRLRDVKVYQGDIYVLTNNTDGRGQASDVDDRLIVLRSEGGRNE